MVELTTKRNRLLIKTSVKETFRTKILVININLLTHFIRKLLDQRPTVQGLVRGLQNVTNRYKATVGMAGHSADLLYIRHVQ